jgi:hypothetical protein
MSLISDCIYTAIRRAIVSSSLASRYGANCRCVPCSICNVSMAEHEPLHLSKGTAGIQWGLAQTKGKDSG